MTVAATAQQAQAAPMSWPSCWRAGVAPTRKPVLRSWEMSPALEAATATMVYDKHPIFDHFRKVDEDLVLGVMDRKGEAAPLAFMLRRG